MYEITISTGFRHYNDHCKSCGRKESSLRLNQYAQNHLREYLLKELGAEDVVLSALDRFVLRNFFLWIQESKHVSASTVQRVYDVLGALFRFLVDEELLAANPMARVEKPRRNPHPIVPLSVEQVQALIDSCDGSTFTGLRNKLVIALMFDTGVRATEFCMVDLDDVDLAGRRILLRQTKTGGASVYLLQWNRGEITLQVFAVARVSAIYPPDHHRRQRSRWSSLAKYTHSQIQ